VAQGSEGDEDEHERGAPGLSSTPPRPPPILGAHEERRSVKDHLASLDRQDEIETAFAP